MSEEKKKAWNKPLDKDNASMEFLGGLRLFMKETIIGFDPFSLHEIVNYAGSWGISRTLFLGTILFALLNILALEVSTSPLAAVGWMFFWFIGTAPVWLPIALIVASYHLWVWYKRSLYIAGRDPIVLEVKMPRDIMKSPRAMEKIGRAHV